MLLKKDAEKLNQEMQKIVEIDGHSKGPKETRLHRRQGKKGKIQTSESVKRRKRKSKRRRRFQKIYQARARLPRQGVVVSFKFCQGRERNRDGKEDQYLFALALSSERSSGRW